jgi:sodium-dependent dicarboxylate transporter 2/3/5
VDDTIVAITAALALFVIPAGKSSDRLLEWEDTARLPWGILLLFGGGIALAAGFDKSGLSVWLGSQLFGMQGLSVFVLLLVVIAVVNFLTEITSNLATTAMLLPILASLAGVLGIDPFVLMAGATLAASCAFMLPVATPPNAIVFGSGKLDIGDMLRAGFGLNLISILLLAVGAWLVLN